MRKLPISQEIRDVNDYSLNLIKYYEANYNNNDNYRQCRTPSIRHREIPVTSLFATLTEMTSQQNVISSQKLNQKTGNKLQSRYAQTKINSSNSFGTESKMAHESELCFFFTQTVIH